MNDKNKRVFIAIVVLAYIISPFDFPGPIDDIIVALIGSLLEYKINQRIKGDKEDE